MSTLCKKFSLKPFKKNALHTLYVIEVSVIVWSCLELGDTVAMSPVDRMRSLSLKLVSLGKIYAGTPRYFPLGKHSYPPVIMFSFLLVRIFQLAVYYFVNSNLISLPSCIIYVSMSLWYRSAGSRWCSRCLLNYPLITTSLFKPVLSVETMILFLYIRGTSQAQSIMSDPSNEQTDEYAMLTSANVSRGCRVPSQVSRTGSVSAELGRGLCHLHHAGDWSTVAASSRGL